jgi:hypothetical protein
VRYHPDGPLFVGDKVSLEVVAPPGISLREDARVRVEVNGEESLGSAEFDRYGLGRRLQATFTWAWDTSSLQPGEHSLEISVTPDGPTWTETVSLLPQSAAPYPDARWAEAESDCCLVYYITGTDAGRDIDSLLEMLDAQAESAAVKLNTSIDEAIPIVFLPRVLGHGGFTSSEIAVSYLDANYAELETAMVVHHELVHLLDGRAGGELRATFLVEGLAVYLSGGHFKAEPLLPRAAALLEPGEECSQTTRQPIFSGFRLPVLYAASPAPAGCGLGQFVPFERLAENFYRTQHEAGYLEAGALVEFMVQTWGWEAFNAFYRDIHPVENGSQADAANAALQEHFGLSLEQLEQRFRAALESQPPSSLTVQDVRLSIAFFDTVRRYQQVLDPSAYFLNAWLPDLKSMREKGITADLLRRPMSPENIAAETLLNAAGDALVAGEYDRAERLIAAVNAVLDELN